MLENASIYTQNFQDQFNDNEFYANPKKTKLHIVIKGEEHVIGNSIVFNTETTNEQIPVYAYNNSLYAKYLNGKSIITGMIGLRKTTVDRILSMVENKSKKEEALKELNVLEQSMSNLEELENATEDKKELAQLASMYKEKMTQRDKLIKNLDTWYAKDTGLSTNDTTKDLLYLRRDLGDEDISFRIVYESDMLDTEDQIMDVLFVKKSQDISIDKSDIIEIYQFVGNPKKHLTSTPNKEA
ncbi:MAG: hypothetical protein ACRCX2_05310 [Paraclostridium sp.]